MISVANIIIPPLDRAYSYLVPTELAEQVTIGSLVDVALGRRISHGFVIELSALQTSPEYQLKPINNLIAPRCFNNDQLELFKWTAQYYSFPLGAVVDTAVPNYVPAKTRKIVKLINAKASVRGDKQREIINFLSSVNQVCDYRVLQKRFKNCSSSLKGLIKENIISITEIQVETATSLIGSSAEWAKKEVTLNEEQRLALDTVHSAMLNSLAQPILLHGVTGSGKTEVYIEAAEIALKRDQGAIIVVPEIALTPQLITRFQARLGDNIAILHSAINKRARWNNWCKLLAGDCRLAIGARSAVFAPVANLGLIIIDEEHDGSYKQSDSLRYHARDLAVVRANIVGCPVILGSATPSLESFHNALRKKYHYVSLPTRHTSGKSLQIQVVDLNLIKPKEMISQNISPQLFEAMHTVLNTDGQIFILYNRRGFASYMQCEKCGHCISCPNCSVTLTYHQKLHSLICHYCNLRHTPSTYCAQCQTGEQPGKLVQRGAGTEKIFDEVQELFPQHAITRLDRDVADDHDSYQQIFDDLRAGKTKILIGTQMIAKGHDLPNVHLVGVIDCDVGLHFPDFRSSERVFQLLTQAAGRAGRGSVPGQVLLQTRLPLHHSITHTQHQNYTNFAKLELRARKDALYPPYAKMARLLASGVDNNLTHTTLTNIRDILHEIITTEQLKVTVLGPAPAPIGRIKAKFRWHLLLKANSTKDLQRAINIVRQIKTSSKIKLIIDRDPQDLL